MPNTSCFFCELEGVNSQAFILSHLTKQKMREAVSTKSKAIEFMLSKFALSHASLRKKLGNIWTSPVQIIPLEVPQRNAFIVGWGSTFRGIGGNENEESAETVAYIAWYNPNPYKRGEYENEEGRKRKGNYACMFTPFFNSIKKASGDFMWVEAFYKMCDKVERTWTEIKLASPTIIEGEERHEELPVEDSTPSKAPSRVAKRRNQRSKNQRS